jgi:hypothetical protein
MNGANLEGIPEAQKAELLQQIELIQMKDALR